MFASILSDQELREKLISVVQKQKFHKHYERTVELANFYRQILTGDDQKDILVKYKQSETDEQQEQRIRLTNSRTKYVAQRVYKAWGEVERVENVVDSITMEEGNNSQDLLEDLNKRLDHFYNNDNIKEYLHESVKFLNFYDPNTFIVCEQKSDDEGNIWPYPVEFYSDKVVNYDLCNGFLQWIIFRHDKLIYKEKSKDYTIGHIYYLYAPYYAFKLEQLGDDEYGGDLEVIQIEIEENKPDRFSIEQFETNLDFTPAICPGYIKDPETNRETNVGILDPAEKVFIDMIHTKSEYDLAKALHGFIQKFVYAPQCTYSHPEKGHCYNGILDKTMENCPVCEGKGRIVHITVQDVVVMTLPNSRETMFDLDKLVHYVEIPQAIIQEYKENLANQERDVMNAVFNSHVFSQSEIVKTATEKQMEYRGANNQFYTYGQKWSQVYRFLVRSVAGYLSIDEGLSVMHSFPKDFHLESIEDLLGQRQKALAAGVPMTIMEQIDYRILAKQSRDNPEVLEMIKARDEFRPWKDKDPQERMFLISTFSQANELHDKYILYLCFDDIMDEIEYEYSDPPFYMMNFERRKEIVQEKIQKYKATFQHEEQVDARTALQTVADGTEV